MSDILRLLALMGRNRGAMALAVLLALVATLSGILLMAVSGWFIASMALAGAAGATMNYFTPGAIIRALAIARTAGRYGERVSSHEATFRVLAGLRRWFYDALEPLAPARLAGAASGDVLARIRNDIERLELVFLRLLSPVVVAVLATTVVTAVLALYDGAVALCVLLLLLAAGAALPCWAARSGASPSRDQQAVTAGMKELLVDRFDGLADLKLAGLETALTARLAALDDRQLAAEARLARLQGLSLAGVGLAANLSALAVLVLAIPLVTSARLAPAELPMLVLLAVASFDAVAPLPLAAQSLAGTLASARRLFALVDQPAAVTDPPRPVPMPAASDLVFADVSFRYRADGPLVLSALDLDLRERRRIALVGETGAGKSSVAHLAMRFWNPCVGEIRLGGVSVDRLPLDACRRRIAVAPQHPHLFAATVRDNLRLGRPEATDAEIEAAARAAQIHDVVSAMPKGYATFVGARGHLLSGGEARRLSVARALLKDAPILILDEPTEGLDAETAARLMEGVLVAARDRSILLVTHRPAGLDAMDEIVVLEGGRVADRGRFRDLSRAGGPLAAFHSRLGDRPDPT